MNKIFLYKNKISLNNNVLLPAIRLGEKKCRVLSVNAALT